jgi:hypothetical protein
MKALVVALLVILLAGCGSAPPGWTSAKWYTDRNFKEVEAQCHVQALSRYHAKNDAGAEKAEQDEIFYSCMRANDWVYQGGEMK